MSANHVTPEQRAMRKAADRRRRQADRALVPVTVANVLGVPLKELAALMRQADVTGPLTVATARRWRAHPEQAPEWVRSWLESIRAQAVWRHAKHEQQREVERAAHEKRIDEAYRDIARMLKDGDRKLRQGHWLDRHDDHMTVLADIAWRAAKDCGLASGDTNPDWWSLSPEEREALRIFGYSVPPEPDTNRVVSLRARVQS